MCVCCIRITYGSLSSSLPVCLSFLISFNNATKKICHWARTRTLEALTCQKIEKIKMNSEYTPRRCSTEGESDRDRELRQNEPENCEEREYVHSTHEYLCHRHTSTWITSKKELVCRIRVPTAITHTLRSQIRHMNNNAKESNQKPTKRRKKNIHNEDARREKKIWLPQKKNKYEYIYLYI